MAERHPSVAELTDALTSIWRASALADCPTNVVDFPEVFVWDYAEVGRKDKSASGRMLMPLRTDAPIVVTSNDPIEVTATLASTTKHYTFTPHVQAHNVDVALREADEARRVLWNAVDRAVRLKCLSTFNRLRIEAQELHGARMAGELDMHKVDDAITMIGLGDGPGSTGLVPTTVMSMTSCADFTKVDPLRWLERHVTYRCEVAVRKCVGDPRTGSAIRASANPSTDDFPASHIEAAMNLDMVGWLHLADDLEGE